MDAIRCKEWLIFRTGSLVGYNETARSRRLKPSPSALTLTCLQLYYLCARWLSGGFLQSDMAPLVPLWRRGHLTLGSHFR